MMHRHATRVKNPGGQIVLGGDNVSPLVEIGLTDPPKSGDAMATQATPDPKGLHIKLDLFSCRHLLRERS